MTAHSFPRTILVPLLALALLASAPLIAADATDAELSVSGATETPSETVSVDGTSYEIDAFATVQPGDSFDVDVTADGSYLVDLYDSSDRTVESAAGSGSERVTFDGDLEPGTYALALYVDGNYVDVFPVVVTGYDVTVDAPSEVSSDEDAFSVTADVAETALEGSPAGVEIAVWDGDTVLREDASSLGDGQYEAAFSGADLEAGAYSVTAVAQGTETIGSMSEVLGVSASHGLTVSDSSDDDSGEDDSNEDVPPSEPEETDESDGDDSETDDGSDETDGDDSETDDGSDETDGDDENDSAEQNDDDGSEETDDGVQQPNLEDDSDDTADDGAEDDDSDAVPLVGPVAIAVAALVAGLLARVCRQ